MLQLRAQVLGLVGVYVLFLVLCGFLSPPAAGMVAFAALGLALGLFYSARLSRAVRTLTTAAQRVAAGDFQHRVPVQGRDEVAELGASFNLMAAALEQITAERSARRVEDLVAQLPMVIYSAQPVGDYAVTFMSANVREMLGYEPHEFVSAPAFWRQRLHPEDAPGVLAALTRVVEEPRLTLEYRFQHRDGAYRWTRDEARVVRDPTGRPVEIVGSWMDITETRRAEAELQGARAARARERATLRSILASMSDGLVLLNAEGRVAHVNPRAEELLDMPLQQHLGQRFATAFLANQHRMADPDALWAELQTALARIEERPSFEVTVLGERSRHLRVQLFPVSLEGTAPGVGLMLHDITHECELRRLKDELVSTVSHELRTPLASLVGFAELLLVRPYDDEQRHQFLTIMYEEGQRLTKLLNNFLDLQRLESGRQRIAPAPQALPALVERAVATLGDDPRHPCVLDLPAHLPLVQADPDGMQQVLVNLLSNARKYSPSGGEVRICARLVGGMVEVAVRDQGLGIPIDLLPRLFDRFYRVDRSDRQTIRGTGLGLAICKHLIEAHGGRIWAESAGEGQGATFRFTLPVTDQAESGEIAVSVLVVDDHPPSRSLLRIHVERAGFRALEADGPDQGLAALAGDPTIRLVLTDLHMPTREAGRAFIRAVRQGWPGLPVAVVTAYPDDLRDLLGATDGVELVLPKPVQRPGVEQALHLLRSPGREA